MVTKTVAHAEVNVLEQLHERLRETGHPTLSQLLIDADQQRVVLSGQVPTFYLKQLAQTIAAQVCGNHQILNETTVANGAIGIVPA